MTMENPMPKDNEKSPQWDHEALGNSSAEAQNGNAYALGPVEKRRVWLCNWVKCQHLTQIYKKWVCLQFRFRYFADHGHVELV